MFKACPVMKRHNELQKSLSLEEMSHVTCRSLSPKHYSALEVKMGHGGQDEPQNQPEIIFHELYWL